jgi:hypothetical protein
MKPNYFGGGASASVDASTAAQAAGVIPEKRV